MFCNKKFLKKGFSLVEIIVVVGISSALLSVSAYSYNLLKEKNKTLTTLHNIVFAFRQAQAFSQASYSDSGWGINIEDGEVTVFKGSSFIGRDQSFDRIFETSSYIVVTGLTDITFPKLSGLPQSTGTITLTNNTDTKEIVVNQEGMVSY